MARYLNRTKIEWCTRTWNPLVGCTRGCAYCYSKKIAIRFPDKFPKDFIPTFYPERLDAPLYEKTPQSIFTVSMGDMFDPLVQAEWQRQIFSMTKKANWHIYQILTKRPDRIPADLIANLLVEGNVWFGTTVDSRASINNISELIKNTSPMRTRFVSFEPILSDLNLKSTDLDNIDLVILGAQTNPTVMPKKEWVNNILLAAERARHDKTGTGCSVFIKRSLDPIFDDIAPMNLPRNYPNVHNEIMAFEVELKKKLAHAYLKEGINPMEIPPKNRFHSVEL